MQVNDGIDRDLLWQLEKIRLRRCKQAVVTPRRRLGESLVRRASEIPKERERAQRAAERKQRPGTMTLPEMAGIAGGRRAGRAAPESGEAS